LAHDKDKAYPVELRAPDISRWREGNTGIPYMTTLDSGLPGPHAMVNAITHGNELCGALAIEFLDRTGFKPARGRVTLGFTNVAAFGRFDPAQPNASRFVDEDFNRLWDVATLDGARQSTELARAREIRPLIDQVDYLLDIHSMQHATAPLMLAGTKDKGVELALKVGEPELIVRDQGHAAGRRMRDYGAFDDPASPRAALLVECGQHWEAASFTVARDVTLRFLAGLDLLEPDYAAQHMPKVTPPKPRVIEVTEAVTIETNSFSFVEPFQGLEVIAKAGTVIGHDGGREIRSPYDECVLIMPSRRLAKGQTAVRLGRFVA
jgi:predicted deacylase